VAGITAGSEGRRVIYGIRPEHFSLGGSLQAKISVVEPTGSETQVFAQIGEQKCWGLRGACDGCPGQMLAVAPNLEAVHLFDTRPA